MSIDIPKTFDAIVDCISRFADLPEPEVRQRVWDEALQLGTNVGADMRRFGATPHVYDDRMVDVYVEGDGFIFETMVFWARPSRQEWIHNACQRLRAHASSCGIPPDTMRVLMLGDGTGNDSLYLCNEGFQIEYFDVPGSRTYTFATRRFEHYGVLDRSLRLVTRYENCLTGQYDAVVSFEVLEHLEDPVGAVRDMSVMLKTGGIALITEGFGSVSAQFPTHLRSNAKFAGALTLMCLRSSLLLTWSSSAPPRRPMEFTRTEHVRSRDALRLLLHRHGAIGVSVALARRMASGMEPRFAVLTGRQRGATAVW